MKPSVFRHASIKARESFRLLGILSSGSLASLVYEENRYRYNIIHCYYEYGIVLFIIQCEMNSIVQMHTHVYIHECEY